MPRQPDSRIADPITTNPADHTRIRASTFTMFNFMKTAGLALLVVAARSLAADVSEQSTTRVDSTLLRDAVIYLPPFFLPVCFHRRDSRGHDRGGGQAGHDLFRVGPVLPDREPVGESTWCSPPAGPPWTVNPVMSRVSSILVVFSRAGGKLCSCCCQECSDFFHRSVCVSTTTPGIQKAFTAVVHTIHARSYHRIQPTLQRFGEVVVSRCSLRPPAEICCCGGTDR